MSNRDSFGGFYTELVEVFLLKKRNKKKNFPYWLFRKKNIKPQNWDEKAVFTHIEASRNGIEALRNDIEAVPNNVEAVRNDNETVWNGNEMVWNSNDAIRIGNGETLNGYLNP